MLNRHRQQNRRNPSHSSYISGRSLPKDTAVGGIHFVTVFAFQGEGWHMSILRSLFNRTRTAGLIGAATVLYCGTGLAQTYPTPLPQPPAGPQAIQSAVGPAAVSLPVSPYGYASTQPPAIVAPIAPTAPIAAP